ncbi:2OG-Fe(II) oxygenase [Burkholderia thailandensis]|uniref:2OG-Fe(II) oxygenase n=1 Tax=Burkholderia thailandensis TaxID=57975 RepID=UPI0022AC76F8|nr:2OG-Fe(II) oxygenase [Burkholderia thailandensis]MCZ2899764.1 2OG-Fe(II) oxygenase [Burkholderia thailandensis]
MNDFWTPPSNSMRRRIPARTVAIHGGTHAHLGFVVCSRPLPASRCERLCELGRSFPPECPTVVGQDVLVDHRVGVVRMIPCEKRTLHVYRLVWDAALDATRRHYHLTVSGITRMPHYVEYHAGFGHFHWHNDYSHESEDAPRKLTVIVQLSEPHEYEGGDLEVFGSSIAVAPRHRGSIICLPSFVEHRVTPVVAGVRRVLVAWIAGPRLK